MTTWHCSTAHSRAGVAALCQTACQKSRFSRLTGGRGQQPPYLLYLLILKMPKHNSVNINANRNHLSRLTPEFRFGCVSLEFGPPLWWIGVSLLPLICHTCKLSLQQSFRQTQKQLQDVLLPINWHLHHWTSHWCFRQGRKSCLFWGGGRQEREGHKL